ncbi:MAG: hypothetical protein SGJ24_00045 [Chloroflexota bacterium]|nr:hypothetical protein [Chloroflexota bacterium]
MVNFIKRLFGSTQDDYLPVTALEKMTLTFPNGQAPIAVRVHTPVNPQSIINALDLSTPTPAFFVSGGAGAMNTESMMSSRATLEDGLARFLHDHQVTLLDGGTATGVMQLIGLARQRRGYTFPLIGVAPDQVVWLPGRERTEAQLADLDAFHSHFVLTDGDDFGTESETLIHLTYALCGRGIRPRLCIVVNGGQIVKREVHRMATQEPRFPILVLDGSGRFADELADAFRAKTSEDPLIQEILDKGNVHFLHIKAGAGPVRSWLENYCGF